MTATVANQRAWVALGSNLGRSRAILVRAMNALEKLSAAPLSRSSIIQTAPLDCPPHSPPFYNAVVALTPQPGETAESLLSKLQELEAEFGRQRSGIRNEPRKLDLDLVAFRRERRRSPRLTLPHPRAHLRRFVLEPLTELAPTFILPGRRRPVRELLAAVKKTGAKTKAQGKKR